MHARHIGHPLLSDAVYDAPNSGARGNAVGMVGMDKKLFKACCGIMQRPALHAKSLGFVHPISGQLMTFEAPLPSDFVAVLNHLEPGNVTWDGNGT